MFDDAVRASTEDEIQALIDLEAIVLADLEPQLAGRRALFAR